MNPFDATELTVYLKMMKGVHFMLCIFYHSKVFFCLFLFKESKAVDQSHSTGESQDGRLKTTSDSAQTMQFGN